MREDGAALVCPHTSQKRACAHPVNEDLFTGTPVWANHSADFDGGSVSYNGFRQSSHER
jgi:hypothetical protein